MKINCQRKTIRKKNGKIFSSSKLYTHTSCSTNTEIKCPHFHMSNMKNFWKKSKTNWSTKHHHHHQYLVDGFFVHFSHNNNNDNVFGSVIGINIILLTHREGDHHQWPEIFWPNFPSSLSLWYVTVKIHSHFKEKIEKTRPFELFF